jgi:putative flippase GtrA
MKIKELYAKYAEVIKYLVFGVLTTLVGWAVYFSVLLVGKGVLGLPAEDTSSAKYLLAYTVAQVVQWVAAVLFAFFTNRRWVFTDADRDKPIYKQLPVFAGGRLLTFFLDYLITYFGALVLSKLLPVLSSQILLGREWNINEIAAKLAAAVVVIIVNYFISKLLVFTKKQPRGEL